MKNKIGILEIALKNLLHHKIRTILTILTVALSVTLIVVVLTYFHSNDQRNKQAVIKEIGAYHVQYEKLTAVQQKQIIQNSDVKKYYVMSSIKNIEFPTLRDLNINVATNYMEGFEEGVIQLKQGRIPEAVNEIVMDEWMVEELGYTPRLGEEISLNFKISSEHKLEEETQTFKLVGLTEDIAVRKASRAGIIILSRDFSTQFNTKSNVTVFALLKSDFNAAVKAQKIGKSAGLKNAQIKMNEQFIKAYEINPATIIRAVLAVFVIMLSAGMVIYNIFNIYISQQIRLFGMMKAIGMTQKQLTQLIYTEGLFISLIGGGLGIALGMGSSLAFIPFLNSGLTSGSEIIVEFSPFLMIGAFILGCILVACSVYAPAKRVGKTSEIASIHYNAAAEVMSRSKGIKSIQKQSLSIFTLVRAQALRYRKRTWITIISITLTGLIFILASSILKSMNIESIASNMVPGDYKLSTNSYRSMDKKTDLLNQTVIQHLQSIQGVHSILTEMYDVFIFNKQDAATHLEEFEKIKDSSIRTEIYGYDDVLMNKALATLGNNAVTLDDMKEKNFLIAIANEGGTYQTGDKIKFSKFGEENEHEYTIIGVLPHYITYKGDSAEGGTFIASQDFFERQGMDQRIKQLSVVVGKEHRSQVKQELEAIAADSKRKIQFSSFEEIYKEVNSSKQIIELAAYSFIVTLFMISVLNLVNSNLTSILSRKKEISMIEAIGLTRGQLAVQLGSEGMLVILVSVLLTFVVGIPGGYLGVQLFSQEATYAKYEFPVGSIITLLITYFSVQLLTTCYMHWQLRKESLIERIRNSG